MAGMLDHMPKELRSEAEYLIKLTDYRKLDKLRELRETSKTFMIDIYHHSRGTDAFYSDTEKRYLTFAQLIEHSKSLIENGGKLFTAVLEYKRGVFFTSGKSMPNPSAN